MKHKNYLICFRLHYVSILIGIMIYELRSHKETYPEKSKLKIHTI